MAKSYRVFTGAPPLIDLSTHRKFSWQTVSSQEASSPFPPATLQEAGHRISLLYQNVIFHDQEEEVLDKSEEWENNEDGPTIDWPATNPAEASSRLTDGSVDDLSRFQETCDTDLTGDNTTMQSEGSSISRFPVFNFSLNALSSLSSLLHSRSSSSKVTSLLGVLEVDGPNYVTVKTGQHAGSEVGLLKLIVGDECGAVCKIVAWRETAEAWGGVDNEPALKRGDIVLFENILVSASSHQQDASSKPQITASPYLKSNAQICYRTLPRTHEDKRWRPDLRLADSVPAVRKVSEVATWMERMAGIHATV